MKRKRKDRSGDIDDNEDELWNSLYDIEESDIIEYEHIPFEREDYSVPEQPAPKKSKSKNWAIFPNYPHLGPGNPIFDAAANEMDNIARTHDIAYQEAKSPLDIYKADERFLRSMEGYQSKGDETVEIAVKNKASQALDQESSGNQILHASSDLFNTEINNAVTTCTRSYDGSGFNKNEQLILPVNDIEYLIPVPLTQKKVADDTLAGAATNTPAKPTNVSENNMMQPLSLYDIKKTYYPDLLQDNKNVKLLYPGENVLKHTIECKSEFNIVDCNTLNFGEPIYNYDVRMGIPNTRTIPTDYESFLNTRVFHALRGPQHYSAIDSDNTFPTERASHE
ncbi:unnamed protein product [Brassicogethes aeneus]|uniref:Phospholipase A2-like domain-containing protein n=1 Tax=Brassicogethes aeneus TaxID=1431903 RepID=A0A9P0BGM8_BRAAE|nr:unnamed protein product [Brassicogethes aeneus]